MTDTLNKQKAGFLKNYFGRVAVILLANAVTSILICVVIRAPVDLPDALFATLFWTLYAPLLGLPFVLFSVWWILDRRIPLFVLLIVYSVAIALFFFSPGPPETSEEERRILEERGKANTEAESE